MSDLLAGVADSTLISALVCRPLPPFLQPSQLFSRPHLCCRKLPRASPLAVWRKYGTTERNFVVLYCEQKSNPKQNLFEQIIFDNLSLHKHVISHEHHNKLLRKNVKRQNQRNKSEVTNDQTNKSDYKRLVRAKILHVYWNDNFCRFGWKVVYFFSAAGVRS